MVAIRGGAEVSMIEVLCKRGCLYLVRDSYTDREWQAIGEAPEASAKEDEEKSPK